MLFKMILYYLQSFLYEEAEIEQRTFPGRSVVNLTIKKCRNRDSNCFITVQFQILVIVFKNVLNYSQVYQICDLFQFTQKF